MTDNRDNRTWKKFLETVLNKHEKVNYWKKPRCYNVWHVLTHLLQPVLLAPWFMPWSVYTVNVLHIHNAKCVPVDFRVMICVLTLTPESTLHKINDPKKYNRCDFFWFSCEQKIILPEMFIVHWQIKWIHV